MAVPSNSSNSLRYKFENFLDVTGTIKNKCTTLLAAVNITRRAALDFSNFLADSFESLNTLTSNANSNGLLQYAQAQVNNSSLDLVSEYNSMKTQLVAVQDWMVTNFPATSGELRVYVFDVNKRYTDINLTAAQLSAYKTQLTNLSNTIS